MDGKAATRAFVGSTSSVDGTLRYSVAPRVSSLNALATSLETLLLSHSFSLSLSGQDESRVRTRERTRAPFVAPAPTLLFLLLRFLVSLSVIHIQPHESLSNTFLRRHSSSTSSFISTSSDYHPTVLYPATPNLSRISPRCATARA